jgi:hypothetical protein
VQPDLDAVATNETFLFIIALPVSVFAVTVAVQLTAHADVIVIVPSFSTQNNGLFADEAG